jgi:hypothetical protein
MDPMRLIWGAQMMRDGEAPKLTIANGRNWPTAGSCDRQLPGGPISLPTKATVNMQSRDTNCRSELSGFLLRTCPPPRERARRVAVRTR